MVSWHGVFRLMISLVVLAIISLVVMKLFVIHPLDSDTRVFLASFYKNLAKFIFIGSSTALAVYVYTRIARN